MPPTYDTPEPRVVACAACPVSAPCRTLSMGSHYWQHLFKRLPCSDLRAQCTVANFIIIYKARIVWRHRVCVLFCSAHGWCAAVRTGRASPHSGLRGCRRRARPTGTAAHSRIILYGFTLESLDRFTFSLHCNSSDLLSEVDPERFTRTAHSQAELRAI